MTYGATGGAVAAAAAAEAQRRQEEEEEYMTTYTPEDLRDDWEFKIVRASMEPFRNPDKLRQLVEDEARAGWILVEKFDNNRVRFKRPASARANDHALAPGVDPYRTTYGMGSGAVVAIVLGLIVLLTAGVVAFTIIMAT